MLEKDKKMANFNLWDEDDILFQIWPHTPESSYLDLYAQKISQQYL